MYVCECACLSVLIYFCVFVSVTLYVSVARIYGLGAVISHPSSVPGVFVCVDVSECVFVRMCARQCVCILSYQKMTLI